MCLIPRKKNDILTEATRLVDNVQKKTIVHVLSKGRKKPVVYVQDKA